ncbi:hypothetical protein MSG28_000935 [Choristoneura fumiferana]|uniref:Uncharacterized protein n=1 Tax=Choristoneura fumiferana TaxID=7141 RepID=A0ACC0K304_CHOFU|nr:hypothetical protein MSG28_000935 [Choristoneura fumiferana]
MTKQRTVWFLVGLEHALRFNQSVCALLFPIALQITVAAYCAQKAGSMATLDRESDPLPKIAASPLVPLNIQAGHGGTLQTLNCSAREIRDQRRSMRRVARSEPLYRRADIRQQPYVISSNQRHNKPTHDQAPDQQVSLDSRITNDDIQAANILMLFAKRHLNIYNDEARTNTSATECVANSNNNNTSKNYTIPHKLLLRIVKSLRIPAFAGRARQRWKKDFTMKLMVSCMMVRHVVPSMPMPLLLQQAMHVAEQLVNHARLKKMPDEQDICCLDCGMLPVLPVTGQCGHTRCLECIRNSATCTCGTPAPQDLYVDTCVQYLIGKLLANKQSSRVALRATEQPPVRGQLLHDFVCAILGRVIQELKSIKLRSKVRFKSQSCVQLRSNKFVANMPPRAPHPQDSSPNSLGYLDFSSSLWVTKTESPVPVDYVLEDKSDVNLESATSGSMVNDCVALKMRCENCQALARRRTVAQRLSRGLRVSLTISPDSFSAPDVPARLPMTPQARVLHACELIRRQCYLEAAAHLARAATCTDFYLARRLLVQTIAILLEDREPELVAREVSGFVGQQAAESWLTSSDLECVLCRDTLVAPVTTPCGHTYCRRCIEHSMDYRRTCPLCMRDLENFNLALTKKTQFVCAALASINILHSPPPLDPSVVPVFVCVTAFPKVPCPLMISDPRYRVFIRRILESGTRRLGMVARNEDHSDSDYGTMLEVRDCVECHDGRIILSTIGISRFKIVERIMDGCLARVEMLTDKVPTDPNTIQILRLIGTEVGIKACVWIKNLEYSVRSKIERAFGKMPYTDEEWWKNPDGPDWLWWLIASLPLAPELKGMMISSSRLVTRLCAMRRSLQLVLDAAAYGHCMRDDTQ